MEENKKSDPQKPGEHTMQNDIRDMFEQSSVEESQKIFRLARENDAEAQLTLRDKKTDHIFIVVGIIILCIAVIIAGWTITHSSKVPTETDLQGVNKKSLFNAGYEKTFSLVDLQTFEKAAAWKLIVEGAPTDNATAVTIVPATKLPDIFNVTGDTAFSGIGAVHVGILDNSKTPFIVAEVNSIDAATDAVSSNTRTLTDGLAIFFAYDTLSASARAELSTEPIIYQNQAMYKVKAQAKSAPVEKTEQAKTATAEDVLQDIAASIGSLPSIDEVVSNQTLFVYQFVRQKYLIIAPNEAAVIEVLARIGM